MRKEILVIKSTGEKEPFSEEKYRRALERTGVSQKVIDEAVEKVQTLFDGEVSAKELYRETFELLKKKERPSAGRYNLKNAIFELGPSGYPFESFMGDLFEWMGYKVEVGIIVQGNCVEHEVDIVAFKDETHVMVECKFHNHSGIYTSVKVPLYVRSRFDDLNECPEDSKYCHFHEGYVVTNTRFSHDSMAYAKCKGLKLLGWDYPSKGSLRELIDKSGLHPITCLTSLKKQDKLKLFKHGITSCRSVAKNVGTLKKMKFHRDKIRDIVSEAEAICDKNQT